MLDLEELLATRLLVQGNSGSGKSHLLRRLLEQSANLALDIAHRGYVLETGTIVASGTADELRSNDVVRRAYLGV